MKTENNLSLLPWGALIELLDNDPDYRANRELSKRIVANVPPIVNYYLGTMSEKLLSRLDAIMKCSVYAEYYIFLAEPFDSNDQKPYWHRVSLYDARDCTLMSYTSRITLRHFYKLARKERINQNNQQELIDYYDYESLLSCDQPEEDCDNLDQKRMKKAFELLSKRDQITLKCLVIDKMTGIDAYTVLEPLIHPRAKNDMSSEEVKSSWSSKQKQDAVSLMKGRALKHLLENYNHIVNKERYEN